MQAIFVQPVIIRDKQKNLKHLLLKNIDKNIIEKAIEETKIASKETGIAVQGLEKLIVKEDNINTDIIKESHKYCRFFWNGFVLLDIDGKNHGTCCFFDSKDNVDKIDLIENYKIPTDCSLIEMYNSEGYWKLREDISNGNLSKYCRNCNASIGAYNNMSEKIINFEEPFFL